MAPSIVRVRGLLGAPSHPEAGLALSWDGGRITSLAPSEPGAEPTFEFPRALVSPGFVDGHTHFAAWSVNREQIQLAGAATRADALGRIARATPDSGWIQGQGWDANLWTEAPDRWTLDALWSLPVFLDSLDVHAAWVNSAALERAGITAATPDPSGGRIVRDASGAATGVLLERAVDLVRDRVPLPEPDRLLAALRRAQAEAHRLGVTGIHDVEGPEAYQAFQRLQAEGGLRLRVLFHHPVEHLDRLVRRGVRSGMGGEWLVEGGVKMFLDGSLGSRTAWMLDPYEGSRDRGMPLCSREEADRAMRTAAAAGLACAVHAIGDAAVRRALDLMESLPLAAIPHRIEHLQCVAPADLERTARAGIVASMQPAHILADIPVADRHWGGRSRGAYAFRSLRDRGTTLVFGSDVPVATMDPRAGVFAALERRPLGPRRGASWYPQEHLDLGEIIEAYTEAAARAGGVAHRRGRLAPGMDADFVVWDVDPAVDRGNGDAFLHARVLMTVVGGEVVYRDSP